MNNDSSFISKARSACISNLELSDIHNCAVGSFINSILSSNDLMLEVGCGNGDIQKYIKSNYIGIDNYMVGSYNNLLVCDAYKMSFANNIFNFILIKDSINYFSNIDLLVSECDRVKKKDGYILFSEFIGINYSEFIFPIKKFIKFKLKLLRNAWDYTYKEYYSKAYVYNYLLLHYKDVRIVNFDIDGRYGFLCR